MAISLEPEVLRTDIIQGLQDMARRGESVSAMVSYIQVELGFDKNFIVPTLGYFCRAFCLSLKDVLPLREWVETHNDQDIASLLAQIKQWKN